MKFSEFLDQEAERYVEHAVAEVAAPALPATIEDVQIAKITAIQSVIIMGLFVGFMIFLVSRTVESTNEMEAEKPRE